MTSVWPALWPPWKRTTMSACSDNQSTILPFPSSPHWAPTTTTLAISRMFPLQNSLYEHDRFGKPVPAFPDHAPSQNTAGAARMRGIPPDKGCGLSTQARRGFGADLEGSQPIDIPRKSKGAAGQRGGTARRHRRDGGLNPACRAARPSNQRFRYGRNRRGGRASGDPDRPAHGRDASGPLLLSL